MKELTCLTCNTDGQPYFSKFKIETIEKPDYEKKDPNCIDDEQLPLTECPRYYNKLIKKGKYQIVETEYWNLYVNEEFARTIYHGIHNLKAKPEEVDLFAPPIIDYDKCSFLDLLNTPDYFDPKEIPFMTTRVKSVEDFINIRGMKNPLLEPEEGFYYTYIRVMTDDMANSDVVKNFEGVDVDGEPVKLLAYVPIKDAAFLTTSAALFIAAIAYFF